MSGRKKSQPKLQMTKYRIQGGSYSPSIFGNNVAVVAYRLMLQVLKLPVPPLVIGESPDISKITKNLAQRNRDKLLKCCEAGKKDEALFGDELIFRKYYPEALLVYAYITMTKGVYLRTSDRLLIEEAIAVEKRRAKSYSTARMRKQRTMQLNHLLNVLENYKNGIAQDGSTPHGIKIRLFHTEKGAKRQQKKSRDKSRNKHASKKTKVMTDKEKQFFVETYMMLRLIHGPIEVRKMFSRFAPDIDQKQIIYWARMNGYTDSKDRPSARFIGVMRGLLNKEISVDIDY